KDINALLRNINNLNEQIQKLEPHGLLANDLYDKRDQLIDSLSEQMNIKVHYSKSSSSSLDIADGLVSIELVDESGQSFGDGVYLLEVKEDEPLSEAVNKISITYEQGEGTGGTYDNAPVSSIHVDGYDNIGDLDLLASVGSLSALVESYGYQSDDGVIGDYPEVLAKLNEMASEFAKAFNSVHEAGNDANGVPGEKFFITKGDVDADITAENITVDKKILADGNLIAASDPEKGSKNGNNALNLADVFDNAIEGLNDSSPRKFFTSLIGDLAVNTEEAIKMTENTAVLHQQVNHSRMSTSAVSLDEEIANLVKFQHAYNASARNMTAIDEMIDRIINHLGIVGR